MFFSMREKSDKFCKICHKQLTQVIVYDCSWYKCDNCGKIFEVEEYWE